MTHQVVIKDLAKTEFVLGLISTIADAIKIEQFQHIQEKIGEVIIALETLKSFLRTAEVDAKVNDWGVMTPKWAPLNAARNWFPKQYPQFIDTIWKMSASGLFGLPTEADATGDAREDVDKYLACASMDGVDRVKLFRLAWDASVSSFGGRQEVYEHYFFGDPVRMAGLLVATYDRTDYMDRIKAFLQRDS
jgi:4-hydroxyphenylacetate 3-monooxygenase